MGTIFLALFVNICIMVHKMNSFRKFIGLAALIGANIGYGQVPVSISGLYNTGETASQGLTSSGAVSFWSVTYASSNGGSTANTTFEGTPYVISPSAVTASGYTPSTSTAEWIIAPGASTSASHTTGKTYVNVGGNYLPGNGTGTNEGIFVYSLQFTITRAGLATGAVIVDPLVINMTIAADDGYTVYMNPLGYNVAPTTKPSTYNTSVISLPQGQWNATSQVAINTSNATFYNGTNYLTIVVDNTNGIAGASSSTTWNESGILDYNITAFNGTTEIWSNGRPIVPELPTGIQTGIMVFMATSLMLYYRKSKLAKA